MLHSAWTSGRKERVLLHTLVRGRHMPHVFTVYLQKSHTISSFDYTVPYYIQHSVCLLMPRGGLSD